ncbi:high affinity immunoglobulin epsilon receptor subunit gamma [Anolis carolinensis]|uniref:high affinity immunoglobulin epsilon receptor subunit gamma n=1 Tax=Anolis carolinensis TaxID=28377 RepID=UPI002F2B25A2
MKPYLWMALVLLAAEEADALQAPELCYVLDGILFVYGIVLTFLYCRLKIQYRKKMKILSSEKTEGIYTGLAAHDQETYTTLELPKLQKEPSRKEPLMG